MLRCERCGNPSCIEHLNASRICPACSTQTPTGGDTFKAESGSEPNTFNPASGTSEVEGGSNSFDAAQSPYERANDVAGYAVKPERDDSFVAEETRPLPLDERRGVQLNEIPELSGSSTLWPVTTNSETAILPGFEIQDEETSSHERESLNATIPSFQRPRISISKDEVRSVPESSLRVPSRSIQISPVEEIRTSGKAIAALVFGIVGIPLMGILLGPFAIIFGSMAIYE
ncbi:MAG: DUF4190 domain-containing protein, partial [Acidobacteria bacterium]|nr:DUF4190 domain-containing protein [Acidobacteriota bacterium]